MYCQTIIYGVEMKPRKDCGSAKSVKTSWCISLRLFICQASIPCRNGEKKSHNILHSMTKLIHNQAPIYCFGKHWHNARYLNKTHITLNFLENGPFYTLCFPVSNTHCSTYMYFARNNKQGEKKIQIKRR